MEAEGRLLHEDWSRYDTAHCVFRPRHMTPEELEAVYAWIYRAPLLAPLDLGAPPAPGQRRVAVPGDGVLYKRANPLWQLLIRHRLTHAVWGPLVRLTRARHRHFRRRLATSRSVPGPLRLPVQPSV